MEVAEHSSAERPSERGMARQSVHLYCFASSQTLTHTIAPGVDGRGRVEVLDVNGIAAVFSNVPTDEVCGERAESAMQDPEWVIPRACRHEGVVEEVMARAAVLPVRFGAVFSSSEALAGFLAENWDEVSGYLQTIADREEWAVKGYLDVDKAQAWLMEHDSDLSAQRAQMPASQGARYFHEKRLRARVQEHLKAWRVCAARAIQAELGAHAVDACPLKLQSRDVSGREHGMMFNCAFMLQRGAIDQFRSQVNSAGTSFSEQGVTLEVSGPWPPYSFCPTLGAGE